MSANPAWWRCCLLAIALALALAGCRRHEPSPAAGEPLVLVTFFEEMLPGLRVVAEDFERETGIRVRVQGVPYESYEMWLRTQVLGRTPPDVLIFEGTGVGWSYGQAGRLVGFDEAIERPNPFAGDDAAWKTHFRPPYLQQARDIDGRLWCLPFTQYGVGFFYNKDAYRNLKLEVPQTWPQLMENSRRVVEAGQTALIIGVRPNDAQSTWMVALFEDCLMRVHAPAVNLRKASPDWTFDPADPAGSLDERIDLAERIVAFERGIIDPVRAPEYAFIADTIRDYSRYWRPDFLSVDGVDDIMPVFARGESVHLLNGTWYLTDLAIIHGAMREVAPERVFEWSTFPFPELTEEMTPLIRAGGINQNAGLRASLVVPKQPDRPGREALSMKLCQYLTSPGPNGRIFENSRVYDVPVIEGVAAKPQAMPLLVDQKWAFLPISSYLGYDAQANSEFWTAWQRFLGGRTDREQFLEVLGASHRRSLKRQYQRLATDADRVFIREQLGQIPRWLEN
jgi:ABC-type glycerol-3-phosphate transport system substrate-binding protein